MSEANDIAGTVATLAARQAGRPRPSTRLSGPRRAAVLMLALGQQYGAKVWALLIHGRDEVYPEDIQELAPYVLSHRIWLGPHAASHGLTSELVVKDVVAKVPIP